MESTIKDLKIANSALNDAWAGLLYHNKPDEATSILNTIYRISKLILELTDTTR